VRVNDRDRVQELWRTHLAEPFPEEWLGESIEGVELVLLDADVAGCVSTWLGSSSKLDQQHHQWLRESRRDLDHVLAYLEGTPAAGHFVRLVAMADLVLADR
jgi:hypothetical protein